MLAEQRKATWLMINSNSSESIDLTEFQKICNISELKENNGKKFIVNYVEIAVFKVNGEVFALNNICPHQHSALIYDGFIEEGCVVCPAHGWMFDLKTGKLPTGGKGLDIYHVQVSEGNVFVKVPEKKFNW